MCVSNYICISVKRSIDQRDRSLADLRYQLFAIFTSGLNYFYYFILLLFLFFVAAADGKLMNERMRRVLLVSMNERTNE